MKGAMWQLEYLIIIFTCQDDFLNASDMAPCKYGEDLHYNRSKKCDGIWDCPIHGGDERNCGKCQNYFECSHGSSSCYDETERCDGRAHCANKVDEALCSKERCGPTNGTFLCKNLKCIKEAWRCDRTDDCGDRSDEVNCSVLASRKVIVASVVGALMCGLLLTVALGCTCRLYANCRSYGDSNYVSPVLAIEEEIWRRQSAPPNYDEAMLASQPVASISEESPGGFIAESDDDVPLLDAEETCQTGSSNDEPMLSAQTPSSYFLCETNNENTGHIKSGNVVASSGVLLKSGNGAKVYLNHFHKKSQGLIEIENIVLQRFSDTYSGVAMTEYSDTTTYTNYEILPKDGHNSANRQIKSFSRNVFDDKKCCDRKHLKKRICECIPTVLEQHKNVDLANEHISLICEGEYSDTVMNPVTDILNS